MTTTTTAPPHSSPAGATTIRPEEVAKFSAMAETWWDPTGPFAPLHRFNPARLEVIRNWLLAHFGRDGAPVAPFTGLTLLDAGCGGGLVSEPMCRMGFAVTAIDASEKNIAVAGLHAGQMGLEIDYRCAAPEGLVGYQGRFDVVLILEVIEHVDDPALFLQTVADLLKPGGVLVAATLNRTLKSLALAKIGAEYILRWLPPGTHDWRKFVRPSELAAGLRNAGLEVTDMAGLSLNPLSGVWSAGRDMDVNYMMLAEKPAVS